MKKQISNLNMIYYGYAIPATKQNGCRVGVIAVVIKLFKQCSVSFYTPNYFNLLQSKTGFLKKF